MLITNRLFYMKVANLSMTMYHAISFLWNITPVPKSNTHFFQSDEGVSKVPDTPSLIDEQGD